MQALNLLLQCCESEEECRNTVAECLGHLALLNPPEVIPVIHEKSESTSSSMRSTVVSAIKYTLVDQPHPVDEYLQTSLPALLGLLSDPDRYLLHLTTCCSPLDAAAGKAFAIILLELSK